MALTVHNAEIRTATVEIRTLTVSGHQLTLAVFRQLQEEGLVSWSGEFRGLPWGVVNHHPDKIWESTGAWEYQGKWVGCEHADQHLHVVWQKGSELRRMRAYPPPGVGANRTRWPAVRSAVTDEFAQAAYCANGHKYPPGWLPRYSPASVSFEAEETRCEASLPACHGLEAEREGVPVDTLCTSGPPDWPALRAAIAAEEERRDRIRARWAELGDLPQLFIAV